MSAKIQTAGSGIVVGKNCLPEESSDVVDIIRVASLVSPRTREVCLLRCWRRVDSQVTSVINTQVISIAADLVRIAWAGHVAVRRCCDGCPVIEEIVTETLDSILQKSS